MCEHCQTTENVNAVCVLPQAETSQGNIPLKVNTVNFIEPITLRDLTNGRVSLWHKIRGAVMFGIACIASPCCTPLIVPIIIALLAGMPAAVWMSQNLGLVYGGLTLLSAVSFVLGFRWMRQKSSSVRQKLRPESSSYEIRSQSVTSK